MQEITVLRIEAIKQPIWLRLHYCTSLQRRGSSFPQRLGSTYPRSHGVVSVPAMEGDWERSAGAGAVVVLEMMGAVPT